MIVFIDKILIVLIILINILLIVIFLYNRKIICIFFGLIVYFISYIIISSII